MYFKTRLQGTSTVFRSIQKNYHVFIKVKCIKLAATKAREIRSGKDYRFKRRAKLRA